MVEVCYNLLNLKFGSGNVYPKTSFDGSSLTVYLNGEIDHHNAREIREATDSLIQTNKPRHLRLDFSGVSFMDSSGIGLIMGRYRMMLLYGGTACAVNVPPHLERIMKLSGLGALNIIETRSEMRETAK